jgi:small neutral amino acid transporter SnatA (MarC family)
MKNKVQSLTFLLLLVCIVLTCSGVFAELTAQFRGDTNVSIALTSGNGALIILTFLILIVRHALKNFEVRLRRLEK